MAVTSSDAIGTASANSLKHRGIGPRMYIDNMTLTLHNLMLANTITNVIAAKQTVINEEYVFSIKNC